MSGNGVVNGEVTIARLRLDRIVKKFDLVAYFYPYRDDEETRYANRDRSGWLKLIEVVHWDHEGNLIALDLTLCQARKMLKRLGFRKLSRTAEDRKQRRYRWTNVSSDGEAKYKERHLAWLRQQKNRRDDAVARRNELFG